MMNKFPQYVFFFNNFFNCFLFVNDDDYNDDDDNSNNKNYYDDDNNKNSVFLKRFVYSFDFKKKSILRFPETDNICYA